MVFITLSWSKEYFFALFKGKRCNSWKHTIPCYTGQNFTQSFHVMSNSPTNATTTAVQKGGWWYLYFTDILLSEHKPAEYCWKIILILLPANTAILITSAEKTLGTSLTKKNMVVIPLTYSWCLSPELKYVFPILFHIRKAVWEIWSYHFASAARNDLNFMGQLLNRIALSDFNCCLSKIINFFEDILYSGKLKAKDFEDW